MKTLRSRFALPALLALTVSTAGASGVQIGGNLPTSLSSVELELDVDAQNAVGFGLGVLPLLVPSSGPLPSAGVYYRHFPASTHGGLFYGARLGSNLALTTGTATVGYRFDSGAFYLDGEIGVGATYLASTEFNNPRPMVSLGLNVGLRF